MPGVTCAQWLVRGDSLFNKPTHTMLILYSHQISQISLTTSSHCHAGGSLPMENNLPHVPHTKYPHYWV
jgi:hypothetical protein